MTTELRIFLEMKLVDLSYIPNYSAAGHMYLVLREVEVDGSGVMVPGANQSNSLDRVLRGDSGSIALIAEEKRLQDTNDRYTMLEPTPEARHSIDITSRFTQGGSTTEIWERLKQVAAQINGSFAYEIPSPGLDHVGNSNAVVLTLLESEQIDVRDIPGENGQRYVDSFYIDGAPGGDKDRPTLYATGDVTQADGLNQDATGEFRKINILGRDNVGDTFLNTELDEKFYGQQSSTSSGTDTVRYESSSGGLTFTMTYAQLNGEGSFAPHLHFSGSTTGEDDLHGIERVSLTANADRLNVNAPFIPLPVKTDIDAGGQGQGRDVLDLSSMSNGIKVSQSGDAIVLGANSLAAPTQTNVRYFNFEELTTTSQNDKVTINSGGITHLNTGGGDDYVKVTAPASGGAGFAAATNSGMIIDLGAGNDRVARTTAGTIIYTGDGNDRIEVSQNGQLLIADASTTDRVTWFNIALTGGVRWEGSESP